MMEKVSFDCKLTQGPDALVVTYTIKNDRQQDLGVFNRISRTEVDGALDFSPNNVYRELQGDALVLEKMALPIPPGLRMAAYIPPHASPIPAGKSFTETIIVPIPVAVRQPYRRALVRGEVVPGKPTTVKAAEVVIGVFPLVECALVAEHPAYPDVLTALPPGPAVTGQVKLSAKFSLKPAITVLDYVGFPWP